MKIKKKKTINLWFSYEFSFVSCTDLSKFYTFIGLRFLALCNIAIQMIFTCLKISIHSEKRKIRTTLLTQNSFFSHFYNISRSHLNWISGFKQLCIWKIDRLFRIFMFFFFGDSCTIRAMNLDRWMCFEPSSSENSPHKPIDIIIVSIVHSTRMIFKRSI